MTVRVSRSFGLLPLSAALFFLASCGADHQPAAPQATANEVPVADKPVTVSLEELLKAPRADLAKKCDEVIKEIEVREKARRDGNLKFSLIPLHLPPVWPVFQDLKFLPELGVSVPPYADLADKPAGQEVWRHYARFGDYEAATKLADPATAAELADMKGEVNYPVEWSRFVGIQLHAYQQRIATGEKDGLTALLDLHKQLEKVLDAKTKQGPLGLALLPRGRRTVQLAAAAWKHQGKAAAASEAESGLKDWPTAAEPTVYGWKGSKTYWAKALKSPAVGRIVSSVPAKRALDLLQLPFTAESADAVILCFDRQDTLSELFVTYGPRIQQVYPLAADVASVLADWLPQAVETTPDLCIQSTPQIQWETHLCRQGPTIGGWLRVAKPGEPEPSPLQREFAGLHLDRTFEMNKLLLGGRGKGNSLQLLKDKGLEKIDNPIADFPLQQARLERVEGHDLLREAIMHYDALKTQNMPPHRFLIPLMNTLGVGPLSDEEATRTFGAHLRLIWQSETTEIVLRIPHSNRENVQLEFRDRRDPVESAEERRKTVADFEKADRGRRLEQKKPLQTLPRKLEQFALGATRAQVLGQLPRGQAVFKRDLPDGVLAVNNSPAPGQQPYMIRQIIVRFDSEDKLRWLRIRFEPAAAKGRGGDFMKPITGYLQSSNGGLDAGPSSLLARNQDLPTGPFAPYIHWQDDLSDFSVVVDAGGSEATLQNRSVDDASASSPLAFLPKGVETIAAPIALGTAKADIQAKYPNDTTTTGDGAWLVRPQQAAYDAVLVWFEDDKVHKIAARHRQDPKDKSGPKDMEQQLKNRWGAQLRVIGWPTRQDYTKTSPAALQALTWFDDQTRYRLYWAESENSAARLWSEWRDDRPPP